MASAARPLRFAPRMSGAEALMWAVERDPALSSAFMAVSLLDRAPDVDGFLRRMERAVLLIPRLRQRVSESAAPWNPPAWEDDPDFDLSRHVRRVNLGGEADDRDLRRLAADDYEAGFERDRPLWGFTLVEGLTGGRGALLAKMHHSISDGVGAIRLSAMFTDIERDAPEPDLPEVLPEAPAEPGPSLADAAVGVGRWAVGQIGGWGQRLRHDPQGVTTETVETARSIGRQLLVTERARSPLWSARRSAERSFEAFSIPFSPAKAAAKTLGGTLNDLYVAGVAAGAGAYHRHHGTPVDELRLSMPVSTRDDKSAGGNAFAPSRLLVPTGDIDPLSRFRLVHERLNQTKTERSLGLTDTLAQALRGLPGPVLLPIIRQQVETVDFAASNTRAASFDLYIAGALVLASYPMGPTGGTACNITLMSYRDSLDFGLNADRAAIPDPEILASCLHEGLLEIVAAGS